MKKLWLAFVGIIRILKELGKAHQEMERSLNQLNKVMRSREESDQVVAVNGNEG